MQITTFYPKAAPIGRFRHFQTESLQYKQNPRPWAFGNSKCLGLDGRPQLNYMQSSALIERANYAKRLQSIVPVAKVPQSWNDVPIKTISASSATSIRSPARKVDSTHFFSSKPWSINAVTTLSLGKRLAKSETPDGLAIRLRKRIWSSGTPLALRTSTARVAEPPIDR